MVSNMDGAPIKELTGGINQRALRNYNERLILSVLQRFGPTAGSDLARMTRLSAQTVSNIMRKLEADAVVMRGAPVKGRVGKPSVPMQLNPDGAFAVGLKLGRRSADAALLDLCGEVRAQRTLAYKAPAPEEVFSFLKDALHMFCDGLAPKLRPRVCGIGVATPYEFWQWLDQVNLDHGAHSGWQHIEFQSEIAAFSDMPVFVVNDATAACRAEHLYGRGKEFDDYAYFFVGTYIGGGIVLDENVYEGKKGNAGALGSMRSTGPQGESRQLVDVASLHLLFARLEAAGISPRVLNESPDDWSKWARYVDPWLGQTAQELAKASLSASSVIDFEAILIDGAFPADVRQQLAERTQRYITNQDTRGLVPPRVESGTVGRNARAIGAAAAPLFSQFFLNKNTGFSERS